jgi:hypothetical protein
MGFWWGAKNTPPAAKSQLRFHPDGVLVVGGV